LLRNRTSVNMYQSLFLAVMFYSLAFDANTKQTAKQFCLKVRSISCFMAQVHRKQCRACQNFRRHFIYHLVRQNKVSLSNPQILKDKNRLLKVCYVPATSASFPMLLFFAAAINIIIKQTRQVVHTIKQSILFRCLWSNPSIFFPTKSNICKSVMEISVSNN